MDADTPGNLPEYTVTEISGAVKRTIEGAFDRVRVRAAQRVEVGVDFATRQSQALIDAGVPGIHYYVLNKSQATCRVLDHILDLHKNGHTIIVTTHDLEKVIAHAQRLVVMVKGRVVKDGMPAEVIGGIERYGIRPPCSVQLGQGIRPWVN